MTGLRTESTRSPKASRARALHRYSTLLHSKTVKTIHDRNWSARETSWMSGYAAIGGCL